MKLDDTTRALMQERFGKDSLIALATQEDGMPAVRAVNTLYLDGAFYVITSAKSNKMRQIEKCANVAICGDWFTAQGIGENLGHVLLSENEAVMEKLRSAFAAWYQNGHTNEDNPNTVLLKIRLTNGVLFSHGTKYIIEF